MGGAPGWPEGEVTFLFTDVEGSTQLLERFPRAQPAAIARHLELLEDAVERSGGVVFEWGGDAICAAFPDAASAAWAAIAGQLALAHEPWGETGPVRVRMALHTGEVGLRSGHYFGAPLYRCARLMATAHGEQIVASAATADLLGAGALESARLVDLGRHRLKDLSEPEQIYQLVHPPLRDRFPALRSIGGSPNNLPAAIKTFIGRHDDLARVRELVLDPQARLVTLTGAGGSGKTQLGLQAARSVLEAFPDGVFAVLLAPVAEADRVVPAVADALGVHQAPGRSLLDTVSSYLAPKEALLVLDNFEHVRSAAGDVAHLLAACPKLRVLATSRVPLRVQGERELEVPPLEPDAAGVLFAERAREIRPDFSAEGENADAVAEICRRLDRLPLAIELAAARTRLLSPVAMLDRLEQRLALLVDGPSDLPARQRTLRDAIAWSHDLLDPAHQALLRKLSVFRGGATLAAVEHVCGADALAGLSALAEHNLVRTSWTEDGDSRFEMLETIAEFAREQLEDSGERNEVERRHAEWFAALAEEVEPSLYTGNRRPTWRRLAPERDNMRAVVDWAERNDDAEPAMRMLAPLWQWYYLTPGEGRELAERVLALPSSEGVSSIRAGTLFVAQLCSWPTGHLEGHARFGLASIEAARAAGDNVRLARALAQYGGGWHASLDKQEPIYAEALALAEAAGDEWFRAWVLMCRTMAAMTTQEPSVAIEPGEESVRIFRELDDAWSWAIPGVGLGSARLMLGDLDGAREILEESFPVLIEVGDLTMAQLCLMSLGLTARFAGDFDGARRSYERGLELCLEAGDPVNASFCLEGIAATELEDLERAARLLGSAQAMFERHPPMIEGFEALYAATAERVAEALGEDFEELVRAGRTEVARDETLVIAQAVPAPTRS